MPTHVANHISTTSDFSPTPPASKSQSLIVLYMMRTWQLQHRSFFTWIQPIEVFLILLKAPMFKALVHKTYMHCLHVREDLFTLQKKREQNL